MALSTSYAKTNPGSAVSNREHLTDILTELEPTERPFTSRLDKKKAESTFVEYTLDSMRAPRNEARAEGQDYTSWNDKHENRARTGNYIQIIGDSWQVSNVQNKVKSVGPADIAAAQVKTMTEVARDIELTCLGNGTRAQQSGSTNYAMDGLGTIISPTGPSHLLAQYRTPVGQIELDASANFDEDALLRYLRSMFIQNGTVNNVTLLADYTLRAAIDGFIRLGDSTATIRKVNYIGGSKEISDTVEIFKSSHGHVAIMNGNPDCMPTTSAAGWAGFLINWNHVCLYELEQINASPGVDAGGGPRGWVQWMGTLAVTHPQAHGKITD